MALNEMFSIKFLHLDPMANFDPTTIILYTHYVIWGNFMILGSVFVTYTIYFYMNLVENNKPVNFLLNLSKYRQKQFEAKKLPVTTP